MKKNTVNAVKADRRTAMREANALVRGGQMTRSQAMKQGYKVALLNAIFVAGLAAHLSFVKADGEKRVATALPAKVGEYLVKGTGHATPKSNILFIDADLAAFRSCVKARIISVKPVV